MWSMSNARAGLITPGTRSWMNRVRAMRPGVSGGCAEVTQRLWPHLLPDFGSREQNRNYLVNVTYFRPA